MNKIIKVLFLSIIIFSNLGYVYADDCLEEELSKNDLDNIIETSATSEDELILNSRIAIAYDRDSKRVIWGKDENKRTAMASTTKIMTAIIVAERSNLSDVVTISSKAAGTGGSRLGLKKNDKISMNDLLYGLMLKSGNDAAVAIAEHIAGSVDEFAALMNEKAKELKLKDTNFITPHGLDNPNHYTTAHELAIITDYALENDIIAKVVATKKCTISINGYSKELINTNELLGKINGVNGVKTGFTNNAGRCLVTSINRDGFNIITVVIQADTKKDRTRDSIKLIDYIYDQYTKINLKEIVNKEFENWCYINKKRIVINKSKNQNLNLKYNDLENNIIVVKKKNIDNIKIEINSIFELNAPIKEKTIIGKLKIKVNNDVIETQDIIICNYISKKNIYDYAMLCIKKWGRC